jgi:cytochrome P450
MGSTQADHWMGSARVLLRTGLALRHGDAGTAIRRLARGADTAVGLRIRGQRTLILLDPTLAGQLLVDHAAVTTKGPGIQLTRPLLGDGLLTSEGENHRRARRLVAPAFSPRRLGGYVDTFAERTEAHIKDWRDGDLLQMREQMGALTLDIVGQSLLGIDLTSDTTGIRSALETGLTRFAQSGFAFGPSGVTRRSRPEDDAQTLAELDSVHRVVDGIIDSRRDNISDDRGDVVSALLSASLAPDGLSPYEVHDHVVTLLVAGHETTANALSWTLHLLGQDPDVEQRLHEEIDGLAGRLPTFDDLPNLPYTRAVITEAIRLYPPAWIVGRTLTTDLVFGGWHVPAGSTVAVSALLMHHDPRWFPDPETFDPQRWLDERRYDVPRYAYLPFGSGPRACIGEQFAWAEATTVLAVIAARWTVRTEPGHTVTPQYAVTLRPGTGLPMRLTARPRA